jgi:hypothetical protein
LVGVEAVLLTVDLDDQPAGEADEVDDVRSDRDLTAEIVVAKPIAAKLAPKSGFGVRHLAAEVLRSCAKPLRNLAMRHRITPTRNPTFVGCRPPRKGEVRANHPAMKISGCSPS